MAQEPVFLNIYDMVSNHLLLLIALLYVPNLFFIIIKVLDKWVPG